ncbi:MAG: hypothetical protein AAGI15_03920 [Pseudomonadota bacterium]
MELIDRYLHAVGERLEAPQRDDVLLELRGAIEDEFDARSAEATDSDTALVEVLRAFGAPAQVASAYGPQRSLIGPALYPEFLSALRTVLLLAMGLLLAICLLQGLFEAETFGPWQLARLALEVALWASAGVLTVFIVLERSAEMPGTGEAFDPRQLPAASAQRINNGDVATNFVSEAVFLLWWNDVLVMQNWLPAFGEAFPLQLGASWSAWSIPLNVLFAALLLLHGSVLLRQHWLRWQLIAEAVLNVALIAIGTALLLAPELVRIEGAFADWVNAERLARMAILVVIGLAVWDLWLSARSWRRPVAGQAI